MTANTTTLTTQEVAARFHELAQEEQWSAIQDEFFADNVKSIEPENSPYFSNAEGKALVRQKGDDFLQKIKAIHRLYTSEPIVTGNHFAVAREIDVTVLGSGRIQINQIMLYKVQNGKIVSEQFFY
ncbi:SnoaL-like domain-containing protein [Dyadobacter sp. CY326]|uniref:SnoaL-like domain-containing protein n=1 Tax=Dyadobacter sp. CY326 TaxID=2907300 RepID=UPI001F21CD6C|nr:SnoaL-like domain-containing protein [Dyadobacter sp. CY326]MCE7064526.1 nuclear transport factor 2 family protein [Dyadobacter sp. CY326]